MTKKNVRNIPIRIAGMGACLPENVVTNEDLAASPDLDTTSKWIEQRTGIKERHIALPGECTSDFAVKAAEQAMKEAGIKASDIDLILAATITPDNIFPTLACWLQKRLGCREIGSLDLTAACSGFVYGLGMARSMITTDGLENVLLVGAETLSKITDWTDRETCIIFADGAGAAVLQPCEEGSSWIGPPFLAAQGEPDILIVPGGGSRKPATVETVENRDHFMKMSGRDVFRFVVERCLQMVDLELTRHNVTLDEIKYIVPHQANQRILDLIADRLKMPREKIFSNIEHVGNTSSASIPIALAEMESKGLIERGDLLLLCAYGGGLTWASVLIKW